MEVPASDIEANLLKELLKRREGDDGQFKALKKYGSSRGKETKLRAIIEILCVMFKWKYIAKI